MNADHPVIQALRETTRIRPADVDFLIANGQSYRGVSLPSGVKRRPLGECIPAADDFERRGLGRFVSGFALRAGERQVLRHAWVSPDDISALDPTLSAPGSVAYWGLAAHHHDRVSDITARGFRSATFNGIPLSLMPGAMKIPGLRPWRFM